MKSFLPPTAACALLLSVVASLPAQDFLLVNPVTSQRGTARVTARSVTITDHLGQVAVYGRDAQFDLPGFTGFSRNLQTDIIAWPATNRGHFRVGTVSALRQVRWRDSKSVIANAGAGGGLIGGAPVGGLPIGGLPTGGLPVGGLPVGGIPGLPTGGTPAVGGTPAGGKQYGPGEYDLVDQRARQQGSVKVTAKTLTIVDNLGLSTTYTRSPAQDTATHRAYSRNNQLNVVGWPVANRGKLAEGSYVAVGRLQWRESRWEIARLGNRPGMKPPVGGGSPILGGAPAVGGLGQFRLKHSTNGGLGLATITATQATLTVPVAGAQKSYVYTRDQLRDQAGYMAYFSAAQNQTILWPINGNQFRASNGAGWQTSNFIISR